MGKNNRHQHVSGRSKRLVFGWRESGDRGEFRLLDKNLLRVDKSYQRDTSERRIHHIASNFHWASFGCILVALREDNSYWVFDGQHRIEGVKRRDDVQDVPCLVFHFAKLSDEARAFVEANIDRGAVSALSKFKGRLAAKDPDAVAIVGIAESYGYEIPEEGKKARNGHIACIAALEKVYKRGAVHCQTVIDLAATLYDGASMDQRILLALSDLELHLVRSGTTLQRRDIQEKLLLLGVPHLLRRMAGLAEALGRSCSSKIGAASLVQEINKGKRNRRLPPIDFTTS